MLNITQVHVQLHNVLKNSLYWSFHFEVKILVTDNLECSANTFNFDMELEYSVLRKVCITLLKQLAISKMEIYQSISQMYFYKRIIPFGMN